MDKHPVLIIGGSAGSISVLIKVLPLIDQTIDFPIILVLHRKNTHDSQLTELFKSKTKLKVKEVEEKEEIRPGYIYVAPADYHVLIEDDHTFSLDYSEKINFSRPAIDATFQSASEVYKNNLVCLLLSGSSVDGVAGLQAVKNNNGSANIQDPDNADFPYMPKQASIHVPIDRVLEVNEMHTFINTLK